MNNVIKKVFFLSCLFFIPLPSAWAFSIHDCYIGAELGLITKLMHEGYSFQDGYGSNAFKRNTPVYNLFAGYKFNDHFGLEISYEGQPPRKNIVRFEEGETPPGENVPIGSGEYDITEYKSRIKNFSIALQYTNKVSFIKKDIDWWIQAGVAKTKIKASCILIDDESPGDPDPSEVTLSEKNFKQSKFTALVKAGINYKCTDRLSARLSITWRHLSKIKMHAIENPSAPPLKLKDGIGVGIGVVVNI